ncbi:MAG: hypothetical protein ACJ8F7_06265 [Gemmataceae bacterium]
MAETNLPLDPSLSTIRRRLISTAPEDVADSVDFETLNAALSEDAEAAPRSPVGYDEVEALLQRYQAEKGRGPAEETRPQLPAPSARRNPLPPPDLRPSGSFHGEVLRQPPAPRNGLPPLSAANGNGYGHVSESERLRTENTELRDMIAELRQYLEANDPQSWEERLKQADALVHERDEMIASQRKQIEEWQHKLQTHRFVASDDDLATMADEVEKERCQVTQDKKKLEEDRQQLQEDEDSLMAQMREMEVGMAKERAELARQRIDLQRLHSEVKHELELLQRGDASVKERLSVFQRRHSEVMRPAGAPPQQSPPPVAPLAAPVAMPVPSARPKDSGVFKRLFGQS